MASRFRGWPFFLAEIQRTLGRVEGTYGAVYDRLESRQAVAQWHVAQAVIREPSLE